MCLVRFCQIKRLTLCANKVTFFTKCTFDIVQHDFGSGFTFLHVNPPSCICTARTNISIRMHLIYMNSICMNPICKHQEEMPVGKILMTNMITLKSYFVKKKDMI